MDDSELDISVSTRSQSKGKDKDKSRKARKSESPPTSGRKRLTSSSTKASPRYALLRPGHAVCPCPCGSLL